MSERTSDHKFALFDTAIGACGIVWTSHITAVQLPLSGEDKTRTRIRQRYDVLAEAVPPAAVQTAIDGMIEVLEGKPNDLSDVMLDLDGVPEFHRGVYQIARTIPPGQTMTYGDIAKRLGGVSNCRAMSVRRSAAIRVRSWCRAIACSPPAASRGGFSANGGVDTKLKMLAIEGAVVNHTPSLFD